jgi:CheY-like chemotaxis protein
VACILVVDDEADIRFVVRGMIERMDPDALTVHEASSGEEALERWQTLRPDVIVLDQRMPGLSGLETAERILAEQPGQRILLFTAFYDVGAEKAATAAGVAARLSKSQLFRLPTELQVLLDGNGSRSRRNVNDPPERPA